MELCTEVFKMICQASGTPDINLFASRISHQLPQYMSWKPKLDPSAEARILFESIGVEPSYRISLLLLRHVFTPL